MVVFDSVLVVANSSSTASPQDPGCPPISVFAIDGDQWFSLGSGMDSGCAALAVFQNNLFVGGWFSTADGNPASRIARWAETPVSVKSKTWGGIKAVYGETKKQ